MDTIAGAKFTHYYNCYNGDFIGCLPCKAHEVNPRDYLNDVIARMPYMQKATNDELLQLLPHKWKKE